MVTTATRNHSALALPLGFKLFWYEIDAVLGQGGFGITYLARDTNLAQPVAIKEYLPVLCATRDATSQVVPVSATAALDYRWGLDRFIDEGRVLAKFDHPAVARVHSVFEAQGTAYLVMRYEEGESLESLLKRERQIPESRLRAILHDVMSGLERMHTDGYLHRDVKPANVYLRANGQALLIDFGAARQALSSHSHSLTTLVSPGYAPFEQYRSDAASQGPWTDIYGLAATAYRAVAGVAPVPALDRSHQILEGSGDPLPQLTQSGLAHYSFGLLAALDRALAFNAAARPQTVAEFRALLQNDEAATGRPLLVEFAPSPLDEFVPTIREAVSPATLLLNAQRRPRKSALAGIALGVAVGVLALSLWRTPATQEAPVRIPAAPTSLEPPSITELLAAADADLHAMRLTVPTDNNALLKYREVLARDPTNATAHAGLARIVGRYLDLATAAAHSRRIDEAREYLTKARHVDASDKRIEAAEAALTRSFAAAGP